MNAPESSDAIASSARTKPLSEAIAHLAAGRIGPAEDLVRHYLVRQPNDVAAICILGDIAARAGLFDEAARLFDRAVELVPDFSEARFNLARILSRSAEIPRALDELDILLARDPSQLSAEKLRLTLLAQIGQHDTAVAGRAALLQKTPDDAQLWTAHANELKTVGRVDEAIAAYRHALALDAEAGEAWWGIANLKIGALGHSDVPVMRAVVESAGSNWRRAIPTHFALARACEDAGNFEEAFSWYKSGNALQRRTHGYDAAATSQEIDAIIAQFTAQFVTERKGYGFASQAPIFILGMTRAGSTLIEQILSSHSQVEGTSELPVVPALINRAAGANRHQHDGSFWSVLARLDAEALRVLGEDYVAAASTYRHTDRPFFIDKLPTNWLNLALISIMLPNAKIIDARRQPMACCFANWKQYYPLGHTFSNDLSDIALYYRDYVRLMTHFDVTLPGRVIRVDHELMVADSEREIRALLDHLGLPFQPACLTPHRTNRPVRTASSEQVRRPITAVGTNVWRNFEPWLDELKMAFGPLASQQT